MPHKCTVVKRNTRRCSHIASRPGGASSRLPELFWLRHAACCSLVLYSYQSTYFFLHVFSVSETEITATVTFLSDTLALHCMLRLSQWLLTRSFVQILQFCGFIVGSLVSFLTHCFSQRRFNTSDHLLRSIALCRLWDISGAFPACTYCCYKVN